MELALQLMEKNTELFNDLVTHYYPIDEYKDAFKYAWNKGEGKINQSRLRLQINGDKYLRSRT